MLTTGGYDSPPPVIIVMGATGSGKTSFINLATQSKLSVGTDLRSCTKEVQASEIVALDGCLTMLLDTPGFQDTFKSDIDILDSIAQSLATLYERGGALAGIIYLHRISDVRFTGTAAKCFKALLAMCGEQSLQNVAIVTNMWGKVAPGTGEAREQQLADDFFKFALDNGAIFCRHNNTVESAHSIIQGILKKEHVTLQIQEEIVDHWKRIEETAAGRELLKGLDEQVEKRLRQLRELQEMLDQAEADAGETRQELEEEVLKLHGELATLSRISGRSMSSVRSKVVDVLFYVAIVAGVFLWVKIQ